jgi:hypothetical protein
MHHTIPSGKYWGGGGLGGFWNARWTCATTASMAAWSDLNGRSLELSAAVESLPKAGST